MTFEKGANWNGNAAGRPVGSRSSIFALRDALVEVFDENQKKLKPAAKKAFKKDPLAYYERFIMPLMPKSVNIVADVRVNDATKAKQIPARDRIKALKEHLDKNTIDVTPQGPEKPDKD